MSGSTNFKTLPPLLNDVKYCSTLSITLKSIKTKGLSKATLEKCAVRVLWWGEAQPICIRSSVTYLVAADVFESYLQLCQVLEFTLTSLPECDDIGSAFLYSPSDILKRPAFKLPIVDHQGNHIGQMVLDIVVSNGKAKPVDKDKAFVVRHFPGTDPSLNIKSIRTVNNKNLAATEIPARVPKEILSYLLGNEMTSDEERRALVLLQQWSPSQSVVGSFLQNL